MAKMAFRRKVNIPRVVSKVGFTVIALYVGGQLLTQLGSVMNATASPFYRGLSLIGWTVSTSAVDCGGSSLNNCITATSGTGILGVVGIVGIASIVLEFVHLKF